MKKKENMLLIYGLVNIKRTKLIRMKYLFYTLSVLLFILGCLAFYKGLMITQQPLAEIKQIAVACFFGMLSRILQSQAHKQSE